MNILVLSVGTRNKIINYFKRAIGNDGLIVATDMSELAPAVYEADKFYKVPRISEDGYIDVILNICVEEKIDAVLSLIDPELSLLAKNKEKFAQLGVVIIGSDYELCEMALDKMQMYHWLKKHGYRCAKSYDNLAEFYTALEGGEVSFPVFVKPVRGSASIAVNKVFNKETLDLLFANSDGLMIQEYLKGQEIGADVYIDIISHEVVSIFTKRKILMRSGETDKAISFKENKLFELIERFVLECGWNAQIDIDLFDIDGEYYFSEVNPRFGGGYPHAYECGCDHMTMIKNNINGLVNKRTVGCYDDGVYMMKYNEMKIVKL